VSLAGVAYVLKRRKGKPPIHYFYAWRGGPCIMRVEGGAKPRLSAEAVAAYQDAHSKRGAAPADTLAALAGDWRASPEWRNLAASTRDIWGRCLSAIVTRFGKAPLGAVEDRRFRHDIMAWRSALSKTPRAADYHVAVLRALLAWGRTQGRIVANHAEGIPQLWKGGNRATIVWEPSEVETLRPALSPAVRDAFDLARLTGLRRGDLVALPLSAIGPHAIIWRTSKSGGERVVTIPILPPLADLLADLRTRYRTKSTQTVLVNSRGKPWTPGGLTASFNSERDAAGLDKHLHDCRGTFVTELCPYLTDQQIAGIMGWQVGRIADIRRIYVDPARTVVAIGEALARRK
jgi:site-specific recombinase XerD